MTTGTTTTVCNILLVEDDPDDARMVVLGLEAHPTMRLEHVRTGAEALERLDQGGIHACLVDHRLPDMTGVDLVRTIRGQHDLPLIMVSGVREERVVAEAFEAGADDFLVKDLEYSEELPGRLEALLG